jgi:hypothetical protein
MELSYLSIGRTLPLTLLKVYEILGVMLWIYYVFMQSSYTLGNFSLGNLCPSSLPICKSGFPMSKPFLFFELIICVYLYVAVTLSLFKITNVWSVNKYIPLIKCLITVHFRITSWEQHIVIWKESVHWKVLSSGMWCHVCILGLFFIAEDGCSMLFWNICFY